MIDASPAVILANELLAAGALRQSTEVLRKAAATGDAVAIYTLALWHVYGHPMSRDFATARTLFAQAGEAGHPQAARTHAVFVAMGAGGPSSWPDALKLLEKAAASDVMAARELELISKMRLDHDCLPQSAPTIELIAKSPALFAVKSCFSAEECAHVVALSKPLMVPSVVVDPTTGEQAPNPIRTSDGTVLGPIQQDLVIHALNMRIAALSGTSEAQGEPLSVLRYLTGQQYRLHHDCLPGEPNQRDLTFIAYLNHGYTGGETRFPAAQIDYRGELGDAILFRNVEPNGSVDTRSRHAGLPVRDGEKWICTRWIRRHNFDPWGMRPR